MEPGVTSRLVFILLDYFGHLAHKRVGIPRATIQDEVYDNYFIPKGMTYRLIAAASLHPLKLKDLWYCSMCGTLHFPGLVLCF